MLGKRDKDLRVVAQITFRLSEKVLKKNNNNFVNSLTLLLNCEKTLVLKQLKITRFRIQDARYTIQEKDLDPLVILIGTFPDLYILYFVPGEIYFKFHGVNPM